MLNELKNMQDPIIFLSAGDLGCLVLMKNTFCVLKFSGEEINVTHKGEEKLASAIMKNEKNLLSVVCND